MEHIIMAILLGQFVFILWREATISSLNKAIKEIALDALTASKAHSAQDFATARAMNKAVDAPQQAPAQAVEHPTKEWVDPVTGRKLEVVRPR